MQNMPTILDSLHKKMTFLKADFEMAFLCRMNLNLSCEMGYLGPYDNGCSPFFVGLHGGKGLYILEFHTKGRSGF